MKMRIPILLFLLFCAAHSDAQQDSSYHLQRTFSDQISDFNVDNIGNVYLLFQNGQLKKIKANGDSLAVFNNVRRFGKPFSIDVSNPLKVLLYYKDFGTIVVLDRLLNNLAVLDLRSQNLLQINAVGQSYDNNIWIFDGLENKLKKIGDDGKLLDQSADLRMVFDSTPSPAIITDQDQLVYLYDPLKGVYIFDYYGGFKGKIPFVGWSDFRVINKSFFGRDRRYLYRYDPGSLNLLQMPIPEYMLDAQKIIVMPGLIYVLRDGEVKMYAY